jgi:hypothetical protein
VSVGVAVNVAMPVVVENGVTSDVGVTVGVTRQRERGPGLIGRTGSKYCGCDSGRSVLCASPEGEGVAEPDAAELSVSPGELAAVSLGDSAGVGEIVAIAEILLLRGFGVAVGRTKIFLILSTSVSSCSWAARVPATLRAPASATRQNETQCSSHPNMILQPASSCRTA